MIGNVTGNGVAVGITGLGAYAPERVLTNGDLEGMVETSDEWIVTRTGIRERRIAEPEQAASDLALPAARGARAGGRAPRGLDLVIVATATPDMLFPATAPIVADALGARRPPPTTSSPGAPASSTRSRRLTGRLPRVSPRRLSSSAPRFSRGSRTGGTARPASSSATAPAPRSSSRPATAASPASSWGPTARVGPTSACLRGFEAADLAGRARGRAPVHQDERRGGLSVRDPRYGQLG